MTPKGSKFHVAPVVSVAPSPKSKRGAAGEGSVDGHSSGSGNVKGSDSSKGKRQTKSPAGDGPGDGDGEEKRATPPVSPASSKKGTKKAVVPAVMEDGEGEKPTANGWKRAQTVASPSSSSSVALSPSSAVSALFVKSALEASLHTTHGLIVELGPHMDHPNSMDASPTGDHQDHKRLGHADVMLGGRGWPAKTVDVSVQHNVMIDICDVEEIILSYTGSLAKRYV